MLDNFLEIGLDSEDIAASFESLRALGFAAVPVGDIRSGAYAVVSDGRVNIGLFAHRAAGPSLGFVRPDLAHYVRSLRRRGIELEFASLGEQEFHELGFRDPNGQLITLVEARTFSPIADDDMKPSVCGRFLEYSLATASIETSRCFWESLGLIEIASGDAPRPWLRIAGGGLTVGLHEAAIFRSGPSFVASQLPARVDYLRAKGFAVESTAPMFSAQRPAATLSVMGGLPLYLAEDPADAT